MDQYQKQRKAYGYLCSVIMVIAIFHALGQIMLQTFLKLNQDTSFTHAPALCMLYGSSFFRAEPCDDNRFDYLLIFSSERKKTLCLSQSCFLRSRYHFPSPTLFLLKDIPSSLHSL